MRRRYALLIGTAVLLAVLGLSAAWFTRSPQAFAGEVDGWGNGFTYQVGLVGDTAVVNVRYDVDSPDAVEQYRTVNQQRALALSELNQARDIDVQITFRRPITPSVVREMAAATGLVVHDYLLVGHSPEGRKISSIEIGSIPADTPDVQEIELPNGQPGGTLAGIMLLKGTLQTTQQSLGSWLNNPDVYMVDTTGVEARELAAKEYAAIVGNRPIKVVLHSPFWKFDW